MVNLIKIYVSKDDCVEHEREAAGDLFPHQSLCHLSYLLFRVHFSNVLALHLERVIRHGPVTDYLLLVQLGKVGQFLQCGDRDLMIRAETTL